MAATRSRHGPGRPIGPCRRPVEDHGVDLGEVAAGDYAVTIWHDDNGNNRFDVGPRGMPKDGWAVANGEALRGQPAFDQVRLAVPAEGLRVPLALHYGR